MESYYFSVEKKESSGQISGSKIFCFVLAGNQFPSYWAGKMSGMAAFLYCKQVPLEGRTNGIRCLQAIIATEIDLVSGQCHSFTLL